MERRWSTTSQLWAAITFGFALLSLVACIVDNDHACQRNVDSQEWKLQNWLSIQFLSLSILSVAFGLFALSFWDECGETYQRRLVDLSYLLGRITFWMIMTNVGIGVHVISTNRREEEHWSWKFESGVDRKNTTTSKINDGKPTCL